MKIVNFSHYSPDHDSDKPLHLQLKEELLRQLRALPANGEYRLPSERSLVELFQINRSTVHRAYVDLLNSRLVRRNPDKSLSVVPGARKQLQGAFPMIGVLVPCRFSDYVEMRGQRSFQYIKGIIDRAAERGVSILTLQLPPADSSPETIQQFLDERCAMLTGLIHLGGGSSKAGEELLNSILNYQAIPQIFISGFADRAYIGSVSSDPETGARELAKYACELGMKRFGMICRESYHSNYFKYSAELRAPVIRKVLLEAGLEVVDKWCAVQLSDDVFDPAMLPELKDIPELVWCSSDTLAAGLTNHLRSCGIRVPQDVSVVGFNGFFSENSAEERIATITHPFYQLGEKAVDLLLEYFEHGLNENNSHVLLDTGLFKGTTLRKKP